MSVEIQKSVHISSSRSLNLFLIIDQEINGLVQDFYDHIDDCNDTTQSEQR